MRGLLLVGALCLPAALTGCRAFYQAPILSMPPDSAGRLDASLSVGTGWNIDLPEVAARAQWRPTRHLTVGGQAGFYQRHDKYPDPYWGVFGSIDKVAREYDAVLDLYRKGRSAGLNAGYVGGRGRASFHALAGVDYAFIGTSFHTEPSLDSIGSSAAGTDQVLYQAWQEYRYVKPWMQVGVRLRQSHEPDAFWPMYVLAAVRVSGFMEVDRRERIYDTNPKGEGPYRMRPLQAAYMVQAMVGGEQVRGRFTLGGQLQAAGVTSQKPYAWWTMPALSAYGYVTYTFRTGRR